MKFNFLGRGSAFNVSEGNTSAYYKNNCNMLLLDCGESVFSTLLMQNLLTNFSSLSVCLTHLHTDHSGSLSSLCFYSYYMLNKKINIIVPPNDNYVDDIKNFLTQTGLPLIFVNFINQNDINKIFPEITKLEYTPTSHESFLRSYGFVINHKSDGVTYYSGDTNSTTILEKIIAQWNKNELIIDNLFMECCLAEYPNMVHTNYKKIIDLIPEELKAKFFCMHIDNNELIPILKEYDIKVVEVIPNQTTIK